jgi:hypothetical protein
MTVYYLRDRHTLLYRRRYWGADPMPYVTREDAARAKAPHEDVVALTNNEARRLTQPETEPNG